MTLIIEVINNESKFNGKAFLTERVEGTKDFCEGFVEAINRCYPNNLVISREV